MAKYLFEHDEKDGSSVNFADDGTLSAMAYSYEISSVGEINLDAKETRKLYEVMKNFYGDSGHS